MYSEKMSGFKLMIEFYKLIYLFSLCAPAFDKFRQFLSIKDTWSLKIRLTELPFQSEMVWRITQSGGTVTSLCDIIFFLQGYLC